MEMKRHQIVAWLPRAGVKEENNDTVYKGADEHCSTQAEAHVTTDISNANKNKKSFNIEMKPENMFNWRFSLMTPFCGP